MSFRSFLLEMVQKPGHCSIVKEEKKLKMLIEDHHYVIIDWEKKHFEVEDAMDSSSRADTADRRDRA